MGNATCYALVWGNAQSLRQSCLARNAQSARSGARYVCEQSTGLFTLRNSLGERRPIQGLRQLACMEVRHG